MSINGPVYMKPKICGHIYCPDSCEVVDPAEWADEPQRSSELVVTTPTGAKLRLQPMGFDSAGNQLWRQLR
ncbi:hypothetical protein I5J35_gp79 [Mycobacterium phage Rem711]|uniref:Uncharacterized protein n=1 Tax=Mycobacterium phage Rem711 TaxID=2079285 RepID=A0A2K9VF16_9CAUD|nr:hypothetical protein I5J35_gp79 [Mycobacterium phage Rem711]AUV60857.1 hypothetical protein SEA_REM711_79 [Mycobacterium phage Rem711]